MTYGYVIVVTTLPEGLTKEEITLQQVPIPNAGAFITTVYPSVKHYLTEMSFVLNMGVRLLYWRHLRSSYQDIEFQTGLITLFEIQLYTISEDDYGNPLETETGRVFLLAYKFNLPSYNFAPRYNSKTAQRR